MRVLVTGAAGFIGSQVVRALLERGHAVSGMVRASTSLHRLDGVRREIDLVAADLVTGEGVEDAVDRVRPEATIHLAWYADPSTYMGAVAENLAALRGSVGLLEALTRRGCERLVLAGTCAEEHDDGSVSGNGSIYGVAKRAVHRIASSLGSDLLTACGHIHFLYGPHEDERRVIPLVIRSLLRGQAIAVTRGEQQRDYLHVADVASALCRLAETQITGRVDVCSGSVIRLTDVFTQIGEVTGRPHLIRRGARHYAEGEIFTIRPNPAPLLSTGWRPRWELREGLEDTVAWWRDVRTKAS